MILRTHLINVGAQPVADNPDVFDLRSGIRQRIRTGQPWHKRQEEALEAVLHSTSLPWYFVSGWEDELIPWKQVASRTWQIPNGLCAWAILNQPEVGEGQWAMYAASLPVSQNEIPELLRISVPELHRWVSNHQVVAILASHPDNLDWRLAVTPTLLDADIGHS